MFDCTCNTQSFFCYEPTQRGWRSSRWWREYGNKLPVSIKRWTISYSYERHCSEEGLCLWTDIPHLVSMYTLCRCNLGLLHDSRWSLCCVTCCWCRIVCFHSGCCSVNTFLCFTPKFLANMLLSLSRWRPPHGRWRWRQQIALKIAGQIMGRRKVLINLSSLCVLLRYPENNRVYFPRKCWCQLTGKGRN